MLNLFSFKRWSTQIFKYKRRKKNCFQEVTKFLVSLRGSATSTQSKVRNINKKDVVRWPKIMFFGSDEFSLPSLQVLHNHMGDQSKLGTVTSLKSPVNSVRQYAEKQLLPVLGWPIDPTKCINYDLGVVVSFGHLIPETIIKAFPFGMINVHASLLPRWRGAAPIIYAILHNDFVTGVSVMKIEPKYFDIGDILAQKTIKIRPDILLPELHNQLAAESAKILINVLNGFPHSLENGKKQNSTMATYAPKVRTDMTVINWSELTARQIYNRYRALYGFRNLSSEFEGKQVQLTDLTVPNIIVPSTKNSLKDVKPGAFLYQRDRKSLFVKCANETFIEIFKLRIEGKKEMTAVEFNNGFLKLIKSTDASFKYNKISVYQ